MQLTHSHQTSGSKTGAMMPTDPSQLDRRARRWLISDAILDQQQMTAVARFAHLHDTELIPSQAKYYRDLLPVTVPGQGQQYAFDVDLDRCSGCKACVTACHKLNGLEPEETWRRVGTLFGQRHDLPLLQHVTTTCHHCVEPACLKACPTNAYEKDPHTGIVRHLDDQCFGCQYCVMACPYEVPQYSESKGIVRKCDMCYGRLAAGEAPACVQACPNQAIRIVVVQQDSARESATFGRFLPESPPPALTVPTTRYRTATTLPEDATAADHFQLRPQHAHASLVLMLVMTQMSVGAWTLATLRMAVLGDRAYTIQLAVSAGIGLVSMLAGLVSATCHLGRPQFAFRGLLGWRHSWLSREAIAFGIYAPLVISVFLFSLADLSTSWMQGVVTSLYWATAFFGWCGIYCSVRLYQFTGRRFWVGAGTSVKFLLTPVILGAALSATLTTWVTTTETDRAVLMVALATVLIASSVKLGHELCRIAYHRRAGTPLFESVSLMLGSLAGLTMARFGVSFVGGIAMPALALVDAACFSCPAPTWTALIVGCCLIGELIERILYFQAVRPWRMPGGMAP